MAPAPAALTLYCPGLLDLPVPEEPGAVAGDLNLPALARILGRARRGLGPPRPHEASLFDLVGLDPECPAVGPVTYAGDGGDPGQDWVLRADPVHLRADLNGVRLFDAAVLDLTEDEAVGLAAEAAAVLTEVGRLEAPTPDRWYLRLAQAPGFTAPTLSQVMGRDLTGRLPSGPDARRWRTLANAVQMGLHASPVNAAREARGQPAVNGLWLWGGGRLPPAAAEGPSVVWGDDPLTAALARHRGADLRPLPPDGGAWARASLGGRHVLVWDRLLRAVSYGDLEGWREGVEALERDWLSPLWEELRSGRIQGLTLAAGGGAVFRLGPWESWAWWRRRGGWLEGLGYREGAP